MEYIVNPVKKFSEGYCFLLKPFDDSCGKVCTFNCQKVCSVDCISNSDNK